METTANEKRTQEMQKGMDGLAEDLKRGLDLGSGPDQAEHSNSVEGTGTGGNVGAEVDELNLKISVLKGQITELVQKAGVSVKAGTENAPVTSSAPEGVPVAAGRVEHAAIAAIRVPDMAVSEESDETKELRRDRERLFNMDPTRVTDEVFLRGLELGVVVVGKQEQAQATETSSAGRVAQSAEPVRSSVENRNATNDRTKTKRREKVKKEKTERRKLTKKQQIIVITAAATIIGLGLAYDVAQFKEWRDRGFKPPSTAVLIEIAKTKILDRELIVPVSAVTPEVLSTKTPVVVQTEEADVIVAKTPVPEATQTSETINEEEERKIIKEVVEKIMTKGPEVKIVMSEHDASDTEYWEKIREYYQKADLLQQKQFPEKINNWIYQGGGAFDQQRLLDFVRITIEGFLGANHKPEEAEVLMEQLLTGGKKLEDVLSKQQKGFIDGLLQTDSFEGLKKSLESMGITY